MKKLLIAAIWILLTGTTYAQIDTTPVPPGSMPQPPMVPPTDTFGKGNWRNDTINRGTTGWNDTLNKENHRGWNRDSMLNRAENRNWKGTGDSVYMQGNKNFNADTVANANRQRKTMNATKSGTDTTLNNQAYSGKRKLSATTTKKEAVATKKLTDRVMMKEGQVIIVKNGKEQKLQKATTFSNGMTILTDGTIKMKGGSTMKLKNGEHIELK